MANELLSRNDEIVDGLYRLGALINRSARSAVYKTEFGESSLPAVIKIRECESPFPEGLKEQWQRAMELAHPNLLKIYATGSSVLNSVPVVYVVMERADESLDNVLAERALTGDETRELLVPAVAALAYLHKKGYAHSRLRASNVLAVQDHLKLSSDSAIRVGDGASAAEDMKALGDLTLQALTQQIPRGDGQLDDIVRRCLDPDSSARWTAEQVQAALKAPAGQPDPPTHKQAPEITLPLASHPERTGIPKWIYAGLAALVLIVVLSAIMRKTNAASVAVASPAAVPTRTPQVETASPSVPAEVPSPPTRAHGRKADGWSVIVATYASRELAEHRMRDMMKRYPKFNPGVLQAPADNQHYLVVLGQNLSEDQADELRKRAVDSGLPRDTYIKRM